MFRLSVFVLLLTSLFACSSTKVPTSDQLTEMNYRVVKGLFDVSEPQEKPDKMPMYPNGNNGLITDIQTNVEYPKEALKEGVEGIVIVAFRITEKGEIKNIEIDKGIDERLDEAALAVMETLKPWYPAEVDGKPSEVDLKVIVTFRKPIEDPEKAFTE